MIPAKLIAMPLVNLSRNQVLLILRISSLNAELLCTDSDRLIVNGNPVF